MSQVKPIGPQDMHKAQVRGILDQSLLRIRLRARRRAAYRDEPIRRGILSRNDVLKGTPRGTLLRDNVLGGTLGIRNVPNVLGTKV